MAKDCKPIMTYFNLNDNYLRFYQMSKVKCKHICNNETFNSALRSHCVILIIYSVKTRFALNCKGIFVAIGFPQWTQNHCLTSMTLQILISKNKDEEFGYTFPELNESCSRDPIHFEHEILVSVWLYIPK